MKLVAIAVDQKGECRPEAEKRIVRGQLHSKRVLLPYLESSDFTFTKKRKITFTFTEKRIVRGQLLDQAGPAPGLRKFKFHFPFH